MSFKDQFMKIKCPKCGAPTIYAKENEFRPFCSKDMKTMTSSLGRTEKIKYQLQSLKKTAYQMLTLTPLSQHNLQKKMNSKTKSPEISLGFCFKIISKWVFSKTLINHFTLFKCDSIILSTSFLPTSLYQMPSGYTNAIGPWSKYDTPLAAVVILLKSLLSNQTLR